LSLRFGFCFFFDGLQSMIADWITLLVDNDQT